MASITTLAPEILFCIIRYTSSTDTLNLGLACKSLFPVCHRGLWSNLSLVPIKGKKTWPGLQIKPDFGSKVCETIEEYWLSSPGLRYTKHVDFGRLIYNDGKEAPVLMQLLEDGKIEPSCMDFCFSLPNLTTVDQRSVFQRLKEYTESKTLKELKVQLYSEIGYSISQIVDLTKITKLELNIPVGGYREVTDPNETVSNRIKEVTSILEKSINLRYLSWKAITDRRYPISSISEELKGLQVAFTNLQRLESLKIETYLFHPSFFVIPPENATALVLNCIASPQWWKEFAACPLMNVTDLRFHHSWANYTNEMRGFLSTEEDVPLDTIKLGKVAVRGLEVLLCRSRVVPQDLGYYILKGNPKLGLEYKLELAGREAKSLVKKYYSRFEANRHLSRLYVEDLYITRYINNADPTTELDIVEEYCEMCIMGEIEKGYVRSWDSAWQRAKNIGSKCKVDLEESYPGSVDHAIHHYTLAFMKGQEDVDEDEFKKECIRLFEEDAQSELKYAVAKAKAKEVVIPTINKFRQVFDGLRKTIVKDTTEKILNSSGIDEMTLMSYWVKEAVARFQDFNITKLNIPDPTG
ncbi:uncharacterized protein DFL_006376 [Arthrobotrys flagrans]|uniref:F-box domain-containing protein n=1 Tax=Arthrobotrys flagrans TaxID=97331 RepID=A0A437A056_ARTFL|nr:hypothetical protein DFL_006376 [Arthrobotrys flagrans]